MQAEQTPHRLKVSHFQSLATRGGCEQTAFGKTAGEVATRQEASGEQAVHVFFMRWSKALRQCRPC